MRKLSLLIVTLLMLAPFSGVQAQQNNKQTASPAPTPKHTPRRPVKTFGKTGMQTIRLADGSEVEVHVTIVGDSESTTAVPAPSLTPTASPSPRPEVQPGGSIPLGVITLTPSKTPGQKRLFETDRDPPQRKLERFLLLPFSKADRDKIKISEGDTYSKEERDIHNQLVHKATDIDAPEGTRLYAPCAGIAITGRHTTLLRDDAGYPVPHHGKKLGFGLGNFVQIWCEEVGVYVLLGHMKTVDDKIPEIWSARLANGDITPNGRLSQLNDRTIGIRVKLGDFLGTVGRTGLGWGDDANEVHSQLYWDKPHVHLEVFERLPLPDSAKNPNARWDPFGWYRSRDDEKRYAQLEQHRDRGLFLEDRLYRIKFAR